MPKKPKASKDERKGSEYLEVPSKPKFSESLRVASDKGKQSAVPSMQLITDTRPSIPTANKPKTFEMLPPPSDLLGRIHTFLPQIAKANEELKQKMAEDKSKIDIEHIEDKSKPYIEMDLGLGLFDLKPKSQSTNSDEDTSSASGLSEGNDSEDIVIAPGSEHTKKPPPRIELLKKTPPPQPHPSPSGDDRGSYP
ncbi:hypothetical protein EV182_004134 [Spiromyces aspiralis]|uniref:Uncharacterized protein n=1 Tax=Spiromyces aspiralis TaxID=68401 RepID=A0ACC1HVJ9_9FUNG|nr:hypothetical protein EV182_004134 [Spiromyces aspiralis]